MNRRTPNNPPSRLDETLPGRRSKAASALFPSPSLNSKVDATYQHLYTLARRIGAEAKLPTVRHLRAELGVSQATLDAALTMLERQQIVYRRQGSGIYVSARLGKPQVCMLCDPSAFVLFGASPFWRTLIEYSQSQGEEMGAAFSFHFTLPVSHSGLQEPMDASPLHAGLVEDILCGRVQGVLAISLPHTVVRWIECHGVPVVAFAGAANRQVTQATTMLIQVGVAELVRRGCRRIGLWSPGLSTQRDNPNGDPHRQRREDFLGALAVHGLEFDPSLCMLPVGNERRLAPGWRVSPGSVEQGFESAWKMFSPETPLRDRPDGILSIDDMVTQGALMALQRRGVRLGVELQIATHANSDSPVLLGWENQLLLLEFNTRELVETMFSALREQMDAMVSSDASRPLLTEAETGVREEREQLIYTLRPRMRTPESASSP